MQVVLLGTAAGGGFPQWNCWCPGCRLARSNPDAAKPRTQSSIAVSADGARWFLINASPDIREQLHRLSSPALPDSAVRYAPIEGVVLTDAELDHTLGIVLLREAGQLSIYATSAVASIIERDSRILATTRAFSDVSVTTLPLDAAARLRCRDGSWSGLSVEAFAVPAGPPRFATTEDAGHTVGLLIRNEMHGHVCAVVPGCGSIGPELLSVLQDVDALFFDGTFWSDEEMIALGLGTRTAREIDHVPISGPGGSLEPLSALRCRHRVYTHINNTNPILIESSPERAEVARAGMIVGFDGLHVIL